MSKRIVQPETDRSHEEFLCDLAGRRRLGAQVEDAGPTLTDLGDTPTEAGFMEWGRRYQSLAGVGEGLFTHIPDVGSLELPGFAEMWAEAGK